MKTKIKTYVKLTIGIFLIVAGFIGLLLPFVPGIILILLGLGMLGYTSKDFDKVRDYFRKKFK